MEDGAAKRLTIPVIGGGWAGCAAAVALAQRGFNVELYETGQALGGRARRVVRDGLPLDNGQHLLIGAYVEARDAIASANGDAADRLARRPLVIAPFGATQPNALRFRVRGLPPPWGALLGLLSAQGLSWRDRVATLKWFANLRGRSYRVRDGATVAEMLADAPPRTRERLLNPLCISALNTPPARASAQIFANALRVAFDGSSDSSDIILPSTDLASLYPDAVARTLAAQGHGIHLRREATIVRHALRHVQVAADGDTIVAPAAIVAVGPHQLVRVFDSAVRAEPAIGRALDQVARLEWEPVVTVYLGYARPIATPAALIQLDGAPGQWLFDRRDILAKARAGAPPLAALLAVVISASGDHDALGNDALIAAVDAQLRRLHPSHPALVWSQVIAERRATYSCTPNAVRPCAGRLADGIYLAGDYTDQQFPATLEAAVRSGRFAAAALARDLSA